MGALARPPVGWRANGLAGAIGLAGALVVLNLWASAQPLQSARTLALLAAYAMVFLFCASNASSGERSAGRTAEFGPVEVMLIGSGAALALHGLYQSLHSFARIAAEQGASLPEAVRARVESGRAVATLGLPGALGGLLALALPIAVGWTASRRSTAGSKAMGAALVIILAAGLIATRSAAPVICLAAASAAVAWSGGTTRRWTGMRRAIAVGLLAIGLMAGALLLVARLSGPTAVLEGSGPVALRAGNWVVAWRILTDHPLVGAGLGCYGIVFPGYREWGMNESRFAHNTYLQLLAEGGLALGAMALMAAVAFALKCLALTRGSAAGRRPFGAYHAVACLAFLLHNTLDFTLYLPSVAFAFFALAGSAQRGPGSGRAPAAGGRALLTAAALLVAGFAVFTSRADQAKESVRRLLEEGAPAVESISLARAAQRANPFDPEAASLLSRLLLEHVATEREGPMLAEAEREAERAVRLDPMTPGHWNHLGRVRLQLRDPIGAYVALHRAADLYPIQISYREDRDALARALRREAQP